MADFDNKEMTDFLLNQIDEYYKNHIPMVFVTIEDGQIGSILEKKQHVMWYHRITVKKYLHSKLFEKTKRNREIEFSRFRSRFMSKFQHENKDKLHSLCEHLADETLSITNL